MAVKFTRSKRSRTPLIKDLGPCPLCKEGIEPDYKDYLALEKFMTDRAKILGRKRSSLCARHQRYVSLAIKRARHLGLLPFTASL